MHAEMNQATTKKLIEEQAAHTATRKRLSTDESCTVALEKMKAEKRVLETKVAAVQLKLIGATGKLSRTRKALAKKTNEGASLQRQLSQLKGRPWWAMKRSKLTTLIEI